MAEKQEWEAYEGYATGTEQGLFVRISPSGNICLSSDLRVHVPEKCRRLRLYRRTDGKALKIHCLRENVAGSLALSKSKGRGGMRCDAVCALRAWKLLPAERTRYDVTLGAEGEFLVDLTKGTEQPFRRKSPGAAGHARRGECPRCGRTVAMKRNGQTWGHEDPEGLPCLSTP